MSARVSGAKSLVMRKLPWLGIGLAAAFWILGSAVDALVFHRGNLLAELYSPDPKDLWIRSLGLFAVMLVGCYAHYLGAKRKRAEEALRESEARLRTVVSNVPVVLFALDRDGVFTLSEGKGLKALGLEPGEVVGQSVFDLYRDVPAVVRDLRRAFIGQSVTATVELGGLQFETQYTPVRDDSGGVAGIIGVATDVTERKRAELALRRSEEFLNKAQEVAGIGSWEIDLITGMLTMSQEMFRMSGMDPDQFDGTPGSAYQSVHREDRPDMLAAMQAAVESGDTTPVEYRIVRPDGTELTIRAEGEFVLDETGKAVRMLGVAQDITERKRAEQALRRSEEFLNKAQEVAGIGSWEMDLATGKFSMSAELFRLGGMDPATFDGSSETAYQFVHPDDRPDMLAAMRSALESGETVSVEYRIVRPDGTEITVWAEGEFVLDDTGKAVRMVGTVQDITERKRVEEALRERENVLKATLEATADGILVVDNQWTLNYVNERFVEMWGLPDDLIQTRDVSILLPFALQQVEEPDALLARIRSVNSTREVTLDTIDLKDGRVFEQFTRPLVKDGEGVGRVVSMRDVTERKRAEEALRDSEARFRTTAETVAAAVFIFQGTKMRYVNPAAEAVTGYARDELLAMDFWDVIHPDMRDVVKERGLARQRGEDVAQRYEVRLLTKSGDECWVDFTAGVIEFEGEPAVLGTAFDITDRKHAQEALQRSEEKYRHFFENVKDIYFETELAGTIIELSPSVERFSYKREDLIGTSVLDIYADAQERKVFVETLLEQGEVIDYELHLKAGDGRVVDSSVSAQFRHDQDGTPIGIEGTLRDISERKRMEKALRDQTRRDSLTGLLNHAAIVEELRDLLSNGSKSATHSVAMVDVDGLKAVNDTFGHQMGDVVLTTVANALARDGVTAGRYGGDEFVAILRDSDREQGERYRQEVLDELACAKVVDSETGSPVPVLASIGLAVYPGEADTIDGLIRLSDSAMYASRRERPVGLQEQNASAPLGSDRAAEMVGQIVPLLTSRDVLEDKVRLVAQRISAGAGYDAVNIDIFSQRTGPPNTRNVYADVPIEVIEEWRNEQRRIEDDPFLQVLLRTRRGIIVADPQNDERLTEVQRKVLRVAELRSAAVVPLFWGEDMIGVMSAASKREGAFAPRDLQFLTTVSTQVTAIVRMATLVEELQTSSTRLGQAHMETVMLLAAAAEAHDQTTGYHLQGVRALTEALGVEVGWTEKDANELGLAGVLHDIGKIRVPDTVLARSDRLAKEEWELMKHHTRWGAEFLAGRPGFELAATIAHAHHERWDGTGYPDGLSGDQIPDAATIVAVADSFDAITHDRPYRRARSVNEAVVEILAGSGGQFSPKVVDALKRIHERNQLPASAPPASEQAA